MMNKEIDRSISNIFEENSLSDQLIDIKATEHYLKVQRGVPVEQVVKEIAALEWNEAIRIVSRISHIVREQNLKD